MTRLGPTLATAIAIAVASVFLAVPASQADSSSLRTQPDHIAWDAASAAQQTQRSSYVRTSRTIGKSVRGRKIKAYYRGHEGARRILLVLGQMHGDEKAGRTTAWWIRDHIRSRPGTGIWVIPSINPDGNARHTRRNARGVDLNRNWPTSGWRRTDRGSRTYGGPRPASEPETRALMAFLRDVKPDFIASIHQPLYGIGKHRGGTVWQRSLSRNLDLPRRHFGVGNPTGTVSPTMTGWYNTRLRDHGVATTIEYGHRPSHHFTTVKAGRGIVDAARMRHR
jgi:murein peptide amidase A